MLHRRPLTVQQILTRRRNARLSTGPRTEEGRRRSSLNRRQLPLPKLAVKMLARFGADPGDFLCVWRDVQFVFEFMGPEMQGQLAALAWDWWLKLHYAPHEASEHITQLIDVRLEKNLARLVSIYGFANRLWRYRLRREFGTTGEVSIWRLRLAVESKLRCYQVPRRARPPLVLPFETTVEESGKIFDELGLWG